MRAVELLPVLKAHGKRGFYRQLIRDLIRHDRVREPLVDRLLVRVQYGVALQHVGLLREALGVYDDVVLDLPAASEDERVIHIRYNLAVQRAVALERLGRPREALDLLTHIGPPDDRIDIEIAKASLVGWYVMTLVRASASLRAYRTGERAIRPYLNHPDHFVTIWAQMGETLFRIQRNRQYDEPARLVLAGQLRNLEEFDAPGLPWATITAGTVLRGLDAEAASAFVEWGHEVATRRGKFFQVAASCDILARLAARYPAAAPDGPSSLTRAVAAYARCHLLLVAPFSHRLRSLAQRGYGWSEERIETLFLQAMSLLPDRETLSLAQMCARIAEDRGLRKDKAFELFVADWAATRYGGRPIAMPEGQPAADVLLTRRVRGRVLGTVIQCKHALHPRKHIPSRTPLVRELLAAYHLDRVEHYVFAVSTSAEGGWRPEQWYHEDSRKVRGLFPDDDVKVSIVTEPDLQTDILLSEGLLHKYFLPDLSDSRLGEVVPP